jgi:hypothetical protein
MNTNSTHAPVPPPPSTAPATPPIPWLLILGLGSLALLWPISFLLGFGTGAPRALVLITIIGLTWIGVVGLGKVPRPVLVLTLTGVGYGVITMIVSAVLGGEFLGGEGRPWWTHVFALATDALWGLLAGLLALAVQKIRAAVTGR